MIIGLFIKIETTRKTLVTNQTKLLDMWKIKGQI